MNFRVTTQVENSNLEQEERLKELLLKREYDSDVLPREFWTVDEWHEIMMRRVKREREIRRLQKELSKNVVQYDMTE